MTKRESQKKIDEEYNAILASIVPRENMFSLPSLEETYSTLEPHVHEDGLREYGEFQRRVIIPKNVFYPCGDMDITPVRAFPNSRVVLLDKNEHAVNALKRSGIGAICQDIRDYRPSDKHDLLILLNPQIHSDLASKHIVNGGYILANNYHASARQLLENPENYDLTGAFEESTLLLNGDKKYNSRKVAEKIEAGVDGLYLFRKLGGKLK